MKQPLDYKRYKGDYDRFADDVARQDSDLGERLRVTQAIFRNCRRYVIKQKSAVTNIIIGLSSQNPQNPFSEDEIAHLRSTWGDDPLFNAKLMGICAHVLLLGKPGRAKTVLCRVAAASIKASFARIQCTVDLDPSDIRGSAFLKDGVIGYMSGPIENNFVLADEINRATGKAQGAILEPMAEGRLTRNINVGESATKLERTIFLPPPFYVVATMNPIEQEGVYRLPEAQQDRFAMQIPMTGISIESIMRVMEINEHEYIKENVKPVATCEQMLDIMRFIHDHVVMTPVAKRYTARLVRSLLPYNDLPFEEEETDHEFENAHAVLLAKPLDLDGSSHTIGDLVEDTMYERMAIVTTSVAKTLAYLRGRRFVLPEDIKKMFPHVARHRIFLTRTAEALIQQRRMLTCGRRLDRSELIERMLRHITAHVPD